MATEKKRTIELLNLVVKFGEEGLVENFEKRFYPIVRDGKVKGKGEVKVYRFEYLHFMTIDGVPIFAGRLLKFMTIEAEQEFDEASEELIESTKTMPSVPSSFFVLDLSTHRLAYLSETRRAPSSSDLEYCLTRLLNMDFARRKAEAKSKILNEMGLKRMTAKVRDEVEEKVARAVSQPQVRVTPLPGLTKIDKSLNPFHIITKLTLKPLPRNNELSNENAKFLRQWEKSEDTIGVETSTLSMTNTEKGLKKVASKNLVKQAASGNYKVKIYGRDEHGEEIDSDLQSISVKFKEKVPSRETVESRSQRLFRKLQESFTKGYIMAVEAKAETIATAKAIVEKLKV